MKRHLIFSAIFLSACGQPFTSAFDQTAGAGGEGSSDGGAGPSSSVTSSQGSGGQGGTGGDVSTTGTTGGNSSSGTGGDCGNCQLDNALAVCLNGQCAIQDCILGYEDCDGSPSNGCEIHSAVDTEHCGSCVNKCYVDNANTSCAGGACQIGQCSPGFQDCNGNYSDGCEAYTETDTEHCGTCNTTCGAVSICDQGQCLCQGAMTSVNSDVTECLQCLGGSCCDKLLDCQNNVLCNQELKTWESCVKNNGQQNCCFGCGFSDQKWLDLRDCQLQNSCAGDCGN